MTPEDVVALYDKVCALWNWEPTMATRTAAYNAWETILGDLDPAAVNAAVDHLARTDAPKPRPGTIRRLIRLTNPAPTPAEAWTTYRQWSDGLQYGGDPTPLHPAVAATARAVGLGLANGGDRTFFTDTYTRIATTWESEQLQ